jgi:hypothetical protein
MTKGGFSYLAGAVNILPCLGLYQDGVGFGFLCCIPLYYGGALSHHLHKLVRVPAFLGRVIAACLLLPCPPTGYSRPSFRVMHRHHGFGNVTWENTQQQLTCTPSR